MTKISAAFGWPFFLPCTLQLLKTMQHPLLELVTMNGLTSCYRTAATQVYLQMRTPL